MPGVIGRVGTALASAGINIGAMQVGRTMAGGLALMGVTVDSPIDDELVTRITAEAGANKAWAVAL